MDVYQQLASEILDILQLSGTEIDLLKQQVLLTLGKYSIGIASTSPKNNILTHIEYFLSAKKIEGLAYKTLENYRFYLTKFEKETPKDIHIVTTNDIRSYLSKQTVSENSLQTILNIIRSFFSWLTQEELIKENPTNRIPASRSSKRQLRKSMSLEELERLRNACKSVREQALVEFLYSTGCRVSEVAGIHLVDVDFSSRSVQVFGKGKKERIVYFSIKAKLLLQQYLLARKGDAALFTNVCQPYKAMHTRSIQKLVKEIGNRAALSVSVYPHLLRHTFATLSLNNGMDITVIQKLLGHSQLSTTQIYASISMENVRREYDRIVS